MKKYQFRSDIAISDSAFYAYGKDYAELIENTCLAVTEAMVDVKKIDPSTSSGPKIVTIKADSPEKLLYNAMEEVIYLKDAKQLVFGSYKCKNLTIKPSGCSATLIMKGEKIDREKHNAHADVKAVTYLDYKIEKIKNGYRASVVLDV